MISAWRKLTKKQDEKHVFPVGIAPVEQSMQKKYAKGVQYNMKVIIKGDRNTGKSTLLHRLTGGKFKEEYLPTHEIQVANVNWNYRGADDIVKVEVWDIVDKSSRKRTQSDSLKITNDEVQESPTDGMALDAELINVYKGTHGVILTMDISKNWTWLYVQRELEKIPYHIPVLVMANFRDMGDHRVVPTDEIVAHLEHLDRPSGSAEVYFTEASMKHGFGLQFIYRFLNMPFLILQRETLLRQLEANTLEIEDTRESLSIDTTSSDQDYGLFKDMMTETLNPTILESNSTNPSPSEQRKEEPARTSTDDTETPTPKPTPTQSKSDSTPKQLPVATVPPTVHVTETPKPSIFQAYKAKLFGGGDATPKKEEVKIPKENSDDAPPIDDFNPGELDDDFLAGGGSGVSSQNRRMKTMSESDDDDGGNPMVAGFEDLESDNEPVFEQQFSIEADFDDLSDDERTKLEESEVSIIAQIKSSKAKNKKQDTDSPIDDIIHDTQSLAVSEKKEYDDIEEDGEHGGEQRVEEAKSVVDTNISLVEQKQDNSNTVAYITNDTSLNTDNKTSKKKRVEIKIENVSRVHQDSNKQEGEDEEEDEVYVIADDVDVENEWMKNNDESDNESDVEVKTTEKKAAEPSVNSTEAVTESVTDTSLQFNVDELEMFMTNQLQRNVEPEVAPSEESPKVKKKKKKKTATSDETTETPPSEKKKKKKKKVTEGTENETPVSTKTKKVKSSDTSTTEKKKKKTKKAPPKSELDSFFDEM
ncbi:rab-like protein 6 [Hydractinia symbiolongicarpus]|uniref:rab-like protein 6 n=1 Tax=Hydractinia symbiolongicarpus TaxID=13093 RepID=UPI00254AD26F|nr:rab-like protein 6 [Hydractinia symbiolongicarpus]